MMGSFKCGLVDMDSGTIHFKDDLGNGLCGYGLSTAAEFGTARSRRQPDIVAVENLAGDGALNLRVRVGEMKFETVSFKEAYA